MHVPITLAALACLTASLFALRQLWPRLRPSLRHLLLALSIFFILISALMSAFRWSTVSPLFDVGLRWLGVAGYELILLVFTRLQPRWLTTLTAVILLPPILAASILLPLTFLFDRDPVRTTSISRDLIVVQRQWNAAGMGNHGVDIALLRIPRALPFLRSQLAAARLYDTQCDTALASVTLDTTRRTVVFHCPPSPDRAGDPPHDIAVRLH